MRATDRSDTPRIGKTIQESSPAWPAAVTPPRGAPNILVILFDDVGFSDFGCYGSPVATPTIDGLAAAGLRYSGFHTTAMCSTTRSALLTGRNHHSVGVGWPRCRWPHDGQRTATLLIDGAPAGSVTTPLGFVNFISWSGLDIGRDRGSPVSDYAAPLSFTGTLRRVTVTMDGDQSLDGDGIGRAEMARQ